MDNTTYLHDKLITVIAEIEHERDQVARLSVVDDNPDAAAESLSELSHMVRQIADRMHAVASETMAVSDEVRVGFKRAGADFDEVLRRLPNPGLHREELVAEVRNGEHDEVVS